jgi:hypothetical protein
VFLLSPAHLGGERARILLREEATFDLATRVRGRDGAPVAEIFAFLSGLYFRGKVAYVSAFAGAPANLPPAYVITSNRGLCRLDTCFNRQALLRLGTVDIDAREPRYARPLTRDARALARTLGDAPVVLLGSVASNKYVDILGEIFGERLWYPQAFAGLGDMSRGAMMLRAARDGTELAYAPVTTNTKLRTCRAR